MWKEVTDGFCMALADSVPGVSGGTVACILGFYDQLIGSINHLVFGKREEKLQGLAYLWKLGIGWVVGMGLAVLVLNALFEKHIHVVSSLFFGFILGALPVVWMDEANTVQEWRKGWVFCVLGMILVVGVTLLNRTSAAAALDLARLTPALALRLFVIGIIAISAMFLPGISGSTMLLVFGAYMPIMKALGAVMHFQFAYLPALSVFVVGILVGAAGVVRLIKEALERWRTQMVYFILGMMAASLYAIVMGPTTLQVPQVPLNQSNFNIWACLIGVGLVLFMEVARFSQRSHRA